MSSQRIVGIILIVVGAALLIIGLNSSESLADQISETFTGRFTKGTMWYIIGGIASAILGLLLVVVKGKG